MAKNNREYKKGYYELKHPEKYKGKSAPYYKSSYEWRMMYWCDLNNRVKEWSYEPFPIPYVFTVPRDAPMWMQNLVDHQQHNYYIDFVAKIVENDGKVYTYLLEIKPFGQTIMPAEPKKKTKKSLEKFFGNMKEYIKNKTKWEAARTYSNKHEFKFVVLTERDIFN